VNIKFKSDIERLFFINFSGYFAHTSHFPEPFLYYMSKTHKITIENDFFYLSQFDSNFLTITPLNHFNRLNVLYTRASQILKLIPGVMAFSLCNSLALGTYHKSSDVDLFVILDKQTFFTSRVLIIIIFNILRLRPKVCLSFFISDCSLSLDSIRLENDYYLSRWLKSLCFQTSSVELIQKFNLLNTCESKYTEGFRFKKFTSFFEKYLKAYQLKRATDKQSNLPKSNGVVINDSMLKFHHNDIREAFNPHYHLQYDEFLQGSHVKTYQQSQQAESR
jgi:hypothetical protein